MAKNGKNLPPIHSLDLQTYQKTTSSFKLYRNWIQCVLNDISLDLLSVQFREIIRRFFSWTQWIKTFKCLNMWLKLTNSTNIWPQTRVSECILCFEALIFDLKSNQMAVRTLTKDVEVWRHQHYLPTSYSRAISQKFFPMVKITYGRINDKRAQEFRRYVWTSVQLWRNVCVYQEMNTYWVLEIQYF